MADIEDAQHDLLLIITTALFVLFTTGLAVPPELPTEPVIISGS
ncbi:MAG: hypothetical protein ACOY46_05590 [Bacillota bacterium]